MLAYRKGSSVAANLTVQSRFLWYPVTLVLTRAAMRPLKKEIYNQLESSILKGRGVEGRERNVGKKMEGTAEWN